MAGGWDTGDVGDLSAGEREVAAALERAEAEIDDAAEVGAAIDDADLAAQWQTDLGNARRLKTRHGKDLRYVRELGWLAWQVERCVGGGQSGRWKRDENEPMRRAHLVAESMIAEAKAAMAAGAREGENEKRYKKRVAELFDWAHQSSNHGPVKSMINSAAPYLALEMDALDQHHDKLNVANGTLHLEAPDRVRLKSPRRSDYATRVAAVAYIADADAPRWEQFMRDVLPDAPTRVFVQKWLGYCLSGDISEQCMVIFEGKGANGKSTLVDVVARLLGDYAMTIPVETFLHQEKRSGAAASPDLARLPGVRLVRTSEPEPGARLSESTIKQFTGGERITARHLFKDMFEFRPTGKLTMSVNIRPTVVGKDHGIRRRIKVVPFTQQFPPGRRGFAEELLAEGPGVLRWLIDGWRLWREDGLGSCPAIEAATTAYFTEMDPIGSFVAECCEANPEAVEFASVLKGAYGRWCAQSSEEEKNATAFGRRLTDMGFAKGKSHGNIVRKGLKVRDEWRQAASGGEREREE